MGDRKTYICGGCGAQILKNEPIQATIITGVKRVKYRGQCCVGAAPPTLGQVVKCAKIETSMMPILTRSEIPRTRGEFKQLIQTIRKEWMPYADSQEREP